VTAVRDIWKDPEDGYDDICVRFFCDGKTKGPGPKCEESIAVADQGIHMSFREAKAFGWNTMHGRHICPACYGQGFGRGYRADAFDPPFTLIHDGRKLKGATFIEKRREELGFGHPYNDRPGRRSE
jgi:hypothetical protein